MESRSIVLVVVAVISISLIFFSIFEVSLKSPAVGINEISGKRGSHSTDLPENFTIENFSAPLNYVMNSGSPSTLEAALSDQFDVQIPDSDNVMLKTQSSVTYQGTPLPIDDSVKDGVTVTSGPSVDGTENTPSSMLMFKYNQCKPECCPGPYSCDRGCVCRTENQKNFIDNRGNN